MAEAFFSHFYGLTPREYRELDPAEYFGLLYNVPMIQSLRSLEVAAGFALLFAPEKVDEFLKPLGARIPTAREMPGLKRILQ